LLEGCSIELTGKNNRLEIHPRARLWGVTIRLVGDNLACRIGGQCRLSGGQYLLEDQGSRLEIGSGTTIFKPANAVNEGGFVRVGSDCLVAAGVDIRNSDAHSLLDATSRARLNPARNVAIEDHVWIGTHSQILKGVTIGSRAVVASRAVVTKNVAPGTLVGGLPARVIRENVDWDHRRLPSGGSV